MKSQKLIKAIMLENKCFLVSKISIDVFMYFYANKCQQAIKWWLSNIYQHDKLHA